MDKEMTRILGELDETRAKLLQVLCEDEAIWQPQIILQLVNEIRSTTRLIRMIKGEKDRFGN